MGTFVPQSDGDHNVVSPSLARLGEEIKAGEIDGILHGVYETIILYTCIIHPFSPFIHRRYHMYTYVHPLYMYTHHTYTLIHLLNTF